MIQKIMLKCKTIETGRIDPLINYPKPRPAMQGQYLFRKKYVAIGFTLVDTLINLWPRPAPLLSREPKRILVANWAHLGDLLTTLPAIGWLKRRYPSSEIGVLTGSWSIPVAEAAKSIINHVHIVDHSGLARSGNRVSRLTRHRESASQARKEIIAVGYDVALDFYAFFPTAALFLAGTEIPIRIGWNSGGLGGFNTHQVFREPLGRHVIEQAGDILRALDPASAPEPGELRPLWPDPLTSLPLELNDPNSYVVLQTGAGAIYKEWPMHKWIALASGLTNIGERVVLAGSGAREVNRNAQIAHLVPHVVDLTGKLNFSQFVSLIGNCRMLIGLDSIAGHVAAAFQRPTVIISGGMTDPAEWGPFNPAATVITARTPCATCHRSGCAIMACIVNTEPEAVLNAAQCIL